ncbi:unnamed protein product [Owenia fusiformis]|uniref:Uncharacterized protein n=1 Tax=Owenia fusiformis TaxID=6347 RepID=A0A8J1UQ52_OWEFU|nr:unnamed protein product [Owenia fusiformis]
MHTCITSCHFSEKNVYLSNNSVTSQDNASRLFPKSLEIPIRFNTTVPIRFNTGVLHLHFSKKMCSSPSLAVCLPWIIFQKGTKFQFSENGQNMPIFRNKRT